jgi:quinol monooxygenase YgiN
MYFNAQDTNQFKQIFYQNQDAIGNFPGCARVQLLRDNTDVNSYTTLSHWKNVSDLEAYRQSELFKGVWSQVKPLFSARPHAFSLVEDLPS